MIRGFRSFHPLILIFYYIVVITGLMLQQHPIFLLLGCLLLIGFNWIIDRGKELKKWWSMIIFLSLFVFIFTPIFNQQGEIILFEIFSRNIYLEAIFQGIMIALTISGILILFATFNTVITSEKFLYLFSRWFPRWTLILMLALRFIPLFRKRLIEIQDVQKTKGLSMKQGNLRTRAQRGMQFIQILLTSSLEEAIQTADSMNARGYGLGKRTNYETFPWKKRDTIALIFLIALCTLTIIGWSMETTTLQFTTKPIIWNEHMGVFLSSWLALVSLPIWIEGKEVMKWRFSQRNN